MPTLYGLLGVESDADEQSIVRAYREQVKRYHPDVNDAPDADTQFKRLTAARDVLTDADERARYDRLGHETYVRRHLGDSWPVGGSADRPAATAGVTGGIEDAARRAASETASATAEPRKTQRADRSDGYATASEYYRPGQRVGARPRTGLDRTLSGLRDVLPWLLAHLALLGGAIVVAVVLLAGSSGGGLPSVTSIVVAATMVGATAGVSALHLASTVYR